MFNRVLLLIPLLFLAFQSPSCAKKSSKHPAPTVAPAPDVPLPTSPNSSDHATELPQLPDQSGTEPGKGPGENPGQSGENWPNLEAALALSPDLLEKTPQELLALYKPIQGTGAWDPKTIRVDPILEWNEIMLDANALDHARRNPDQGGPTRTSRAFAITQLAITAPEPVTGVQLAETIGRVMNRKSWFKLPEWMTSLGLGEAAPVITHGKRVMPRILQELGYKFKYPTLESALRDVLPKMLKRR